MSHILDALIAIALTQSVATAHSPFNQKAAKVAHEYKGSRGIFVIKGATCSTSAHCLILKPSKVNKDFGLYTKR
jgi:hypothetical protein